MSETKKILFPFLEYLQDVVQTNELGADEIESVQVAIQCLSDAFKIHLDSDDDKRNFSLKPTSLKSLLDQHLKEKYQHSNGTVNENQRKLADEFKAKGNTYLVEKKLEDAVRMYGEAIALVPSEPVYYSNRAAAYSQMGKHEEAVNDCEIALSIDPSYSKAYSRLGLAYFGLAKYSNAVEAYKKALELDPNNASVKQSLSTAEKKAKDEQQEDGGLASKTPNVGDGFDFASLLQNPALMNMASKFMQNPQMMGMLKNMAGGAGGLGDLLNNPDSMSMFQELAQNPEIQNAMKDPNIQDTLKNLKK